MTERQTALLERANEMAQYTATHVVAIYGVINGGSCKLNGTATLIGYHDRAFLLSAHHVLKDRPLFQYYAHSVGNGRPPQRLIELARHEDETNDLVMVEVISVWPRCRVDVLLARALEAHWAEEGLRSPFRVECGSRLKRVSLA